MVCTMQPTSLWQVSLVCLFLVLPPPLHYGTYKWLHDPSKNDESKTMGDVKSELQKKHSKVLEPSQLSYQPDDEVVSPVKS